MRCASRRLRRVVLATVRGGRNPAIALFSMCFAWPRSCVLQQCIDMGIDMANAGGPYAGAAEFGDLGDGYVLRRGCGRRAELAVAAHRDPTHASGSGSARHGACRVGPRDGTACACIFAAEISPPRVES